MNPTLISSKSPSRTKKDGNFKIYLDPRISANQLALFAVSAHAKQEMIVRDAKRASIIRLANYQPARTAVSKCYDGDGLSAENLKAEVDRMSAEASLLEPFDQACNKLSAAALLKVIPLAKGIDCEGTKIPRPPRGFDQMLIENVRVSVQPEIVFSMTHRGATRFGGVMVNFSKIESLALRSGKYHAGDYAAFLVFQMLALHFPKEGGPRFGNCFSVDAYRDTIYAAPGSHVTMLKNIQAACRSIARQWDDVQGDNESIPVSEDDPMF